MNYHPEKPQRMEDLHRYYYEDENKGIFRWNGGEGTILGTQCKAELQRYQVGGVLPMDRCVGPSQYCARCAS